MTSTDQITALRAAAAKLGEALNIHDSVSSQARVAQAYECFAALPLPMRDAEHGIAVLADLDLWHGDASPGIRYLADAAQLRLLVEAALLEQARETAAAARHGWKPAANNNAELGTLVREWAEGVNRGRNRPVSRV